MVIFYVFLLIVAAIGALAYIAMFMSHVPGAADERLGKLEALPAVMNEWVRDSELGADGLVVERRYLMPEESAMKYTLQVRYRDPKTDEIVRVDDERVIRRKRVRDKSSSTSA